MGQWVKTLKRGPRNVSPCPEGHLQTQQIFVMYGCSTGTGTQPCSQPHQAREGLFYCREKVDLISLCARVSKVMPRHRKNIFSQELNPPTHTQKFNSFRTSAMATSCGVVMTTAPARFAQGAPAPPSPPQSSCTTLMCSSEVPGGVSTMR